jgi:hypothetical protein
MKKNKCMQLFGYLKDTMQITGDIIAPINIKLDTSINDDCTLLTCDSKILKWNDATKIVDASK